jgi:N-methylhydantoinase B
VSNVKSNPTPVHQTAESEPIVLEIVKGAIRSAQSEMTALLDRTSMSPFIREKKDYFIGFFDSSGALIHSASLPLMGDMIKPLLERFPMAAMREGDIYWYNDCYGSKGAVSHTPDQVLVAPVIVDSNVRAFSLSWAHFNDIGGLRPGTLSSLAESIFHEGTIVPAVRLYAGGELNEDLVAMFAANSRFPAMIHGDLRALGAAVRLGARRMIELYSRYGVRAVDGALERSKQQTADLTRKRIAEMLKPGRYRFVDRVDSDGRGNGPFDISLDMEVAEDGSIRLDTTGSSDQARGPINFLMSPAVPMMTLGLYATRNEAGLLINQGTIDTMEHVKLRLGSILCPRYPAPLGLRGSTFVKVQQAVLGVVNTATNGEALAASNAYSIYYLSGTTDGGENFLLTDGIAVGYGARPKADGIDAVYFIAQENYPVEFIEMGYPARILSYGLNPDTGGPGRWRGGAGVFREVQVLSAQALCSARIEGPNNPPWGTAGGQCGRPGRIVINPGRSDERMLGPINDGLILSQGDVLRIETGGGGGWGHPFDREPERVREDVLDGVVSGESARDDYGVVLTGLDLEVDLPATVSLRASSRAPSSLFHNGAYLDAMN